MLFKRLIIIAIGILLAALAIFFIGDARGWFGAPEPSATQTSASAERRLPVEVHLVATETLSEVLRVSGGLRASEYVSIRSEVQGLLTEVGFREGDRVMPGDLLFRIDDAELQAQRRQTLNRLELARLRADRIESLYRQAGISREELDQARTEVKVLEAESDLLDAMITRTVIRAPFEGITGFREVSPGALVAPASELTTLSMIHPIQVEFSAPERASGRIRSGMEFRFRDARRDRWRTGTVFAVNPRIDPGTRNLLIRGEIPNEDYSLLPGAFVEVEITLAEEQDAILIPSRAIIPGLERQEVMVVGDGGRVEMREVIPGRRLARRIQIREGLEPGDRVLLTGLLQARPGTMVNITKTHGTEDSPDRAGP